MAVAGALAFSVSALAASDLPTQTSAYNSAWQSAPTGYKAPSDDGLGVSPGTIGHVWVIVLENHAYTDSFSPLEGTQSSYLQNLPSQGADLTNYYGTGHSSLDNYISMVSGQAPQEDDQDDCPNYDAMDGSVDTSGTPATNSDFGQLESNAGPDAPFGDNGCVYPSSVNTVFNQLQTAGKSWKVYAQDLDGGIAASGGTTLVAPHSNQDAGYNAGAAETYSDCGAPDASVVGAPDTNGNYSSPAAGVDVTANVNYTSTSGIVDSYVAKHNPLSWFGSLTGTADTTGGAIDGSLCNSSHSGALFGPDDTLYNDLQTTSSTPDLSYIVPDNCSNGHDATCTGNNLTGESAGFPTYNTSTTIPAATNNTGGTVAESAFLSVVIPEIEASPAFKQNGMIVVTYDEAYPPFTYSGDSQATSQLQTADATGSLQNDAAGETLYGRSLSWEPTGPNATIVKSALSGQVLSGGPGNMAYLDEPTSAQVTALNAAGGNDLVACAVNGAGTGGNWASFTAPTATNGHCQPGDQANGNFPENSAKTLDLNVTSGNSYGSTLESETGVSEVYDGAEVTSVAGNAISASNCGAAATYFTLPSDGNNGCVYVGQVTNSPNAGDSTSATSAFTSNVPLVDSLGNPVTALGGAAGSQVAYVVSDTSPDSAVTSNDPFFDPYDATLGGGDAGAVVISPFTKPGTVSNTYYNHYSLLRTIEDVFGEQSNGTNDLTGGITPGSTTETSLDGPYLGFASQPGLAPFGHDIFDVKAIDGYTETVTSTSTVTVPGGTTTVNNNNTTTVDHETDNSSTVTVPGPTVTVTKIDAIVPQLKGYTKAQAEKAIRADGLKVGAVSGSGSVVSSAPSGGKEVRSGTPVSIKLKK
ncbi:MAG TPA: alkaline phosphatase family protein [Solirubrobacteraceae bacterium]|nr:alkaline phosphatase family protein [Solirubrobacteraceae bacterium]